MRRLIQWLFVFLALIVSAQPAAAGQKVRIANSGDYPPYYYFNAQGKLEGFDVDISLALCSVMQVECEVLVEPWKNIIAGLRAKKYDAIVASMAKTPEREKLISFTECYSRSSVSFVGRTDAGLSISPEGLKGKILCAVSDTYQEEYLRKNYGQIAAIKTYETAEETMHALFKGEVDLVLNDSFVIFYFLKTEASGNFDLIGDPLPSDDPSNSAYIAVRQEDDQLRRAFNEAIKTIRLDGTFDKINKKYFPYSTY